MGPDQGFTFLDLKNRIPHEELPKCSILRTGRRHRGAGRRPPGFPHEHLELS